MRTRLISIFLLISCSGALRAQVPLLDTLEKIFTKEPKIIFRLDNRNSFITTQDVKLLGFKLGLEFDNRARVGLAYHWMASDISNEVTVLDEENNLNTYPGELKFRYLGLFAEYAFFRDRNWEFSAPFQIGLGNSFYRYRNKNNRRRSADFGPMVLIEPGVEANYKILSWLGFGLGLGYRIMLITNSDIDERFSAPFYVIKVNVDLRELRDRSREWFK